jgi:DNA topoisomerase-2
MSKDTNVDFTIYFQKGKMEELEKQAGDYGCNGLEKLLKLYSTNSTTNMNLFNSEDRLRKYDTVSEIIDDYYDIRLEHYEDRKEYIIDNLEKQLMVLSNKVRYIGEVLDDNLDLRKKTKTQIVDLLQDKDYDTIDGDEEYHYLTKMPMDSVSEENVAKLAKEHRDKEEELITIKNTTIQQMWLSELSNLEIAYTKYVADRKKESMDEPVKKLVKVVKKKV